MTPSSHPSVTLRRPQRCRAAVCSLTALLALAALAARADDPPAATPRAAMRAFLEAAGAGEYERAAAYLDLQGVPPVQRATRGPVLAHELKAVLDRTLWVELDALSDEPQGERDDELPERRELVGSVDTLDGAVPILLERVSRGADEPRWLIAAPTVARIPALYERYGDGPWAAYLPGVLSEIRLLAMPLWRWIALLVLVAASGLAAIVLTAVLRRLVRPLLARSTTDVDDRLVAASRGPLRLLIGVLLFGAGLYPLGLTVPVHAVLSTVQRALLIVAVTWLLVRLVDVGAHVIEDRLVARGQVLARSAMPLARRTLKTFVAALALLAILNALGVNVTGILAGLGIGGLAVALAAQKTVENLFGGLTLIADQPVRVGDFCRFGDRVGTVEEVGLRSTRIRTLDRTVVTVPNAAFASLSLENYAHRDRIWFHTTLGLRYETTPDQLRHVLVALKKLLASHPMVHPDPARVRFVSFGAYSLDLEIFAYAKTSDINEYLAIQEDLLLRIMDVVADSGTGFAFPSQTVYAGADTGIDGERGRAAEEEVRRWRQSKSLGLPRLSRTELEALAGSLDYPPRGSVDS